MRRFKTVMAGLVPATQERERVMAGTGLASPLIVVMGHRDQPGGDGLGRSKALAVFNQQFDPLSEPRR
jgi:hypothetical protein